MTTKNFYLDINIIGSFPTIDLMPNQKMPEYAFIGRSNVGKSSLINYLSQRKAIARTSKKPGKTQLINLFSVDDKWAFVDLPGYGYAAIARQKRVSWKKMIYDYLEKRENLVNCFVLLDSRVPLQDVDKLFLDWIGKKGIPFSIVFTKIDSLKPLQKKKNIDFIKNELLKYWEILPDMFEVSSLKKIGGSEILKYIGKLNRTVSK